MRAALLLIAVSWVLIGVGPAQEKAKPAPQVPKSGALNELVMEVVRSYPTDGTHTYHWPKSGSWKGCTKDLVYRGKVLARGDKQGRAFCCGLTFEVFLEAWLRWCRQNKIEESIAGFDLEQVRKLQGQWFGSKDDPTCLRTALVENKIGHVVAKWADAKPGDFVQLWRNNGSGHSVVFLSWVKKQKKIVGVRYWSTQKATKGIGEREEGFGDGKRDVDRKRFHLCRVGAIPAK